LHFGDDFVFRRFNGKGRKEWLDEVDFLKKSSLRKLKVRVDKGVMTMNYVNELWTADRPMSF
jgi:hypothetical protein